MELFSWITDLIEFLGITGIIILFSAIYMIRQRWGGRFTFSRTDGRITFNRTNRYNGHYQSNGNGYSGNSTFHSNDNNQYSHTQYEDDDSSNQYNGPHGTGNYVMNGSYDEELDFSNPNHYPIIDSYDNNIDENNPTQPW